MLDTCFLPSLSLSRLFGSDSWSAGTAVVHGLELQMTLLLSQVLHVLLQVENLLKCIAPFLRGIRLKNNNQKRAMAQSLKLLSKGIQVYVKNVKCKARVDLTTGLEGMRPTYN